MAGTVAAVVVAAGRGLRAGGGVPKQYRPMPGGTAIQRSSRCSPVMARLRSCSRSSIPTTRTRSSGRRPGSGCFRRYSAARPGRIRCAPGLEALAAHKPDIVLIHDAARPFASPSLITRAIAAAAKSGAAVPVLPVADTVKTVDATGLVTGTLDRSLLRAVQTPQAFGFAAIVDAHRRALQGRARRFHRRRRARRMGRDDGRDLRRRGRQHQAHHAGGFPARRNHQPVRLSATSAPGSAPTFTSSSDGDHIWLGGVKIPHTRGVTGHSDADVVLHAWSMRSSARSRTATSACIFRPAIRNGGAPPPTASWRLRSSACAPAAG